MMKFMNKKRKVLGNKGFSLVELIIVIAIMAVLMAVLAPQLLKQVENSRVQADNTAASELLNAVKIAVTDEDIYQDLPTAAAQTITWSGAAETITVSAGGAHADLVLEINDTLGLAGDPAPMEVKAKAHEDQQYVISITVGADGIPEVTFTDWADIAAAP
jgi:type IV pilus assembly protein PilA